MVATSKSYLNRFALILIALLGGCFYTDPINQRPSVAIHWDPIALYRGGQVTVEGVADDPDGDIVAYQWRAYACNQTGDVQTCDKTETDSGVDSEFKPFIPTKFVDQATADTHLELNTLHITLEGRDSYGATARPSQVLDLPVGDAAPTLQLAKDQRHTYVVSVPIGIYAQISDLDNNLSEITLSTPWLAEGPALADNQMLSATQDTTDPSRFSARFTPSAIGDWTIAATATDPSQVATQALLPIHVSADHPPCLAQWDPTATSVPNTTIPITDPTLFQVLVVSDDLDPYPSVPNDAIFGTTEFHWSIVPPGGTRQALSGVTGSGVALDPDSYTPGDIVELRVEIQDRVHTLVNCPDTDLTCSVISDQSCLQRLTWRIEVR